MLGDLCNQIDIERIEEIIREVESGGALTKEASSPSSEEETFDVEGIIETLEKIATSKNEEDVLEDTTGEDDNKVDEPDGRSGAADDEDDLDTDPAPGLSKKRLKEMLLKKIRSQNPSPAFERLKTLVEQGEEGLRTKEAQFLIDGLAKLIAARSCQEQ